MSIQTEIIDDLVRTYSDAGMMIEDSNGNMFSECFTPVDSEIQEEFKESDKQIPNELTAEQKLELLLEALQTSGTLSQSTINSINKSNKTL